MADTLQSFPRDAYEPLAILYVERQDLTGLTPEEIFEKYNDALERMYKRNTDIQQVKKPPARNFI